MKCALQRGSMRKAAILFAVVTPGFISCSRKPYDTIVHRGRDGRSDQWVYRIDKDTCISVDTNDDARPDVVKTLRNKELVRIESDRNCDGTVDLAQVYSRGLLVREVHDDDFDSKPESI